MMHLVENFHGLLATLSLNHASGALCYSVERDWALGAGRVSSRWCQGCAGSLPLLKGPPQLGGSHLSSRCCCPQGILHSPSQDQCHCPAHSQTQAADLAWGGLPSG